MNRIWNFFSNKGSTAAYAIITAIFTLVPEGVFQKGFIQCTWPDTAIIMINRLIVCAVILVLSNVAYQYYRKHRKYVCIKGKSYNISVEYGDLLQIEKGKKVINFDECFSTSIGEKPEDIKKDSVCGQYLTKHPIEDINQLIVSSGVKPSCKSSFNQKDSYTLGTIIPRGDFLLMAFAKLDKDGLGKMTYSQYLECLNTLWVQIDRYHGTDDVYLPILGSRITRFDRELTQQELLDIMLSSYRLSPKKLKQPNTLHIVCKEREGFSLNDAYGID